MSVFEKTAVTCPACGSSVTVDLVHSVNAVRRPDLRSAILDRSFQRIACPSCSSQFRVEPMFTYLDTGRKQFIAAMPASALPTWQEAEVRAQASFDKAFGWLGLNEKLIALEHGIDDVTLEMAKLATLRAIGKVKLGVDREFRLVGATADTIGLGWLHTSSEEIDDEYSVPRQLLKDIEAAPETWAALRDDVSGGMFVDYRRALFGVPA